MIRPAAKICVLLLAFALTAGCARDSQREIEDISRQVRSILELPTFEHIYRDIVYVDKERSFLIFKTMDAELLFSINVRIQAGIDLKDGFKIERNPRRGLTIELPPAKILLADADEESIQQYFLKQVGGEISRLEYYDEINYRKEDLIADAVDRGILERAGENAKMLVQSLLENVRGEKVTVLTAGEVVR